MCVSRPLWPLRPIALALGTLLLAGCPSLLTASRARTVRPGTTEGWLALGAYRTVLVGDTTEGAERRREWMPLLDAGVRVGLTEHIDLGGRLGLGGASLAVRFQLLRSASPDTGIDLLLEPSLGATGVLPSARGGVLSGGYAALALPVGVNLGGGSQLVLAPRIAAVSDDFLGTYALPGGSLALALAIAGSPERPWLLIPECGSATVRGGDGSFGGPILQCALGLSGPW